MGATPIGTKNVIRSPVSCETMARRPSGRCFRSFLAGYSHCPYIPQRNVPWFPVGVDMIVYTAKRFWIVGVVLAVVLSMQSLGRAQSGALPVVPDGEGFGMTTRAAYGGGTNPTVYRVTNLNNSGAGSFREALEASGPRVVVFEISGTIALNSDIIIANPYITIAGQTAPSPGITIKNFGPQIYTHDVLMQHIRVRPGDVPPLMANTAGHDGSIAYTSEAYNVVFDHNSFSWAQGKNAEFISLPSGAAISYWRNINSEALYRAANTIVSPGGPSSLGLLFAQNYVNVPSNISAIGNLLAHNSDRNPEIQGPVNAHFINNVVYDWGKDANNYQWATFIYSQDPSVGPPQVDIVGNKYIGGPAPSPFTPLIAVGAYGVPTGTRIYMTDNAVDSTRQAVQPFANYGIDPRVTTPPVSLTGITVRPSSAVESFVLSNAGARPLDRDAVDRRIVSEAQNRTGSVISSQNEVGGWPTLAVNTRALTLPLNQHTVTSSGYTGLELWLQRVRSRG